MSKTNGQTLLFWNETKTFLYRSQICLIENKSFRFGPESALLDQIEMISFDKTNSGTNSNVLVSFRLDIGTFVERLWNIYSFTVLTLLNGPLNDKSRQKNRKICKLLLSSVNQRLQQKFRPTILIFPLRVMRPKIRLVGDSADNPLYGMQSKRGAWETQGTVSKDEPPSVY
jgi:hypothetical protein